MQYPLRPCDRPYDIASVNSVRYKPRSGKLEIELPNTGEAANPRNVDSEATPNLRVDTRVLVSTESPVHAGYCVAQMRDGALHLTPVDAAFQMRPSLAHLDAADDKRKQEDAGAAAGGRGLAGDRRDAAGGTDEETDTKKEREDAQRGELASLGAPEPGHSLVPLQVQVKRRETERQTEMRLHSHAYLKQQEEDERWSRLIPVKGNHPYAVVARNRVVSGANGADTDGMDTSTDMDFTGPAGVPITAVAYLDALCPIHSQELGGGGQATAREMRRETRATRRRPSQPGYRKRSWKVCRWRSAYTLCSRKAKGRCCGFRGSCTSHPREVTRRR